MPLTKGGLPVKLSGKPAPKQPASKQPVSLAGSWKDYMPRGPITLLDALTDPDPLFPFTEDDAILFEKVGLKPRRG